MAEQKEITVNEAITYLYTCSRGANLSADEHEKCKQIYNGLIASANPKPETPQTPQEQLNP